MQEKIRVGIIDDNPVLSAQLKENLSMSEHIEVLFTAANGEEAIQILPTLNQLPQVLLMDIEMPVMNGIEATAIITKETGIKVLILTAFDTDDKVFEAIKAGAAGYLLKDSKPHRIITAIEDVLLGGAPMSPHIAAKTLELLRSKTTTAGEITSPQDYNLSERETEILKLLTQGLSYQQIANSLFISHGTVRKHVENIYGKLHVNTKAQAIHLAHQKRWI
jgi:DNA-binding NarL/FixJ family response regulator